MRIENRVKRTSPRTNRMIMGTGVLALLVTAGSSWVLTRPGQRPAAPTVGSADVGSAPKRETSARGEAAIRRQLPPRAVREMEKVAPGSPDREPDEATVTALSAQHDPGAPVGSAWAQPSVETQAIIEEHTKSTALIPDPDPAPGAPQPDDQLPPPT